MSLTDRFREEQEDAENRNEALEALIDNGFIDGIAAGIAKKVIGDNSLDKLSVKQKGVYETMIYPKLQINCSNKECGHKISMDRVAEAIQSDAASENYYCVDCEYQFRDRKDD